MSNASIQYAIVVDTKRCIGCWSCAVSCKAHNNIPTDTFWNRVLTVGGDEIDTPAGEWPNLKMGYVTLSCQHCSNPACVMVCPVGATYKREDDGIVMQDPEKCIGCRYCMSACPYSGVRSFNWGEPKYSTDFPLGDRNAPIHQKHTVEKCTLCTQRIADGREPGCVEGCPTKARTFGDVNDPRSEVSELLREREHIRLLEEKGTNPNLYYLV